MSRMYREVPAAKQLVVYSPLHDHKFYLGLTGFVDDLGGKSVGKTVEQALRNQLLQGKIVQEEMAAIGIAMNRAKEESVVSGPTRTGVRQIARDARIGKVVDDARYLGDGMPPPQVFQRNGSSVWQRCARHGHAFVPFPHRQE